jgi:hypothetical protein
MPDFTNDQIQQAAQSKRWTALTQLDAVADDFHNYDRYIIREPRLLVPVDVQALVVRDGGQESMVRLPFRDTDVLPPLDVHDPGTPREPGVHLLWSVPTALGRGKIVDDPAAPGDATRRRLELPPLPDRWLVLRLAVARDARDPLVTGWVVEADAATATPLTDWPGVTTNAERFGTAVPAASLTLHVGGPAWAELVAAVAPTEVRVVHIDGDPELQRRVRPIAFATLQCQKDLPFFQFSQTQNFSVLFGRHLGWCRIIGGQNAGSGCDRTDHGSNGMAGCFSSARRCGADMIGSPCATVGTV